MFSIVNMSSLPDDRTARARIRDAALRLFSERGPDAVTIRDVATSAGVSPALVIRHYDSKDGLRTAVDGHVVRLFELMLAEVTVRGAGPSFGDEAVHSLTEVVTTQLPAGSAIPAYLGRMLLTGGPAGSALFAKLYAASQHTLAAMTRAGMASAGSDPEIRAAFLLLNDLSVLILRDRVREAIGVDPLSADGMQRWGTEVLAVYRDGIGGPAADQR